MRGWGRLAEAENAPRENDGDLLAALVWGHRGWVGDRVFHCGLLADVPTTAFAERPARCLAGLVLFVLLLLTRREFEMAVGCERNRGCKPPASCHSAGRDLLKEG